MLMVEAQITSFPLYSLLFVVLFATVAMLYAEGMWGNAIRLVNVITAALLATNFYEPLGNWLENFGETFGTYM